MFETPPVSKDFDFKHYIETNTSSANRTRWITIALVLASVVIFIGFYNSTLKSWTFHRINSLKDFENVPENNASLDSHPTNPIPLPDDYFGLNDFNDKDKPEDSDRRYKGYGFKKFACKFLTANFPKELNLNLISHYIYNSLNKRTNDLLEEECSNEDAPSTQFTKAVKTDLDELLKNKFFYNLERFDCLKISKKVGININGDCQEIKRKEETQKLLEITNIDQTKDGILKLRENDLIRMNRRLLEEAYQGEILESKISIPSTEKLLAKEIPTRIAFDDKVLFVEMPFFDIPIDVNDLGLIGGISLFIILYLLRFSQSREIKNLNISFKEAVKHNELCEFYHSLAMHQVLTVPQMEGELRNKGLAVSAKSIFFLPIIVLILGVGYDYYSVLKYNLYEWDFVKKQLYFQLAPCILLVILMSLKCLERQLHIDRIWRNFHDIRRKDYETLKREYFIEKRKKRDNLSFNKELVRICQRYFSESPPKEQWWLIKLFKSGLYNLKELWREIRRLDSQAGFFLKKKFQQLKK